jgi:putative transposase
MKTSSEITPSQAHLQEAFQQMVEALGVDLPSSPQDLPQLLQSGLAQLLTATLQKERQFYLEDHPEDRGNGYAPSRTVDVGTTPVSFERPRTRQGFYSAVLPKHQRQLPQAYQNLLQSILLEAKSFAAARRTLQAMGLSYSPEQTEQLLQQLYQEAKDFFTRPLATDWLVLFADAKIVDLKDEHEQVRSAVHFLVLGLDLQGKKHMLSATTFWGHEVLESWRQVLINLRNRGLTRVLLWVTDDFSGLTDLLRSLFPNSSHQLCTVHLLRNAQRHLSPAEYATFKERWKELRAASSPESARTQFLALLEKLRPTNKAWVEHLQPRVDHYLAFLEYPCGLHPHLRSTNLPESLNNQIENLRRNAGGHFHTQREALIKIKLLTDHLYQNKWHRTCPGIVTHLAALNRQFQKRFEAELDPKQFLTQNF